jgi:hypothetical protein
MSLNFPNPSRSYDAARRCVRFWGYDGVLEISFFIEAAALLHIFPGADRDELGFLTAFDINCDRIRGVAGKVYARRHRDAYALLASDF